MIWREEILFRKGIFRSQIFAEEWKRKETKSKILNMPTVYLEDRWASEDKEGESEKATRKGDSDRKSWKKEYS